MKVSIILGTRPEIIKMAPIIKACRDKGLDYFVLHTGQHYDYELDKVFFKELKLEPESINLDIGSGNHGEVTGKMLIGIEKVLIREKPDVVIVQGDTNTVLAGTLAAVKLHIPVSHVEAGLRSYDRKQPEEYNRVVADHCSDMLFAPTEKAAKTLKGEGLPEERIFNTGNTVVDSVNHNLDIAKKGSMILDTLGIKPQGYFLATAHREENVDKKECLKDIITGLQNTAAKHNTVVILPMHPRTRNNIKRFGLEGLLSESKNIKVITPVGFLDFIMLEANAKVIISDSGGVQEEACILGVPCVVLREKSDRPESLDVGASLLVGCDSKKMEEATTKMLETDKKWENPFGDGKTGERIINIIQKNLG